MASATVTLVLLAAGQSSRMRGGDKLLEKIGGVPLISRMVEECLAAGPTRVVMARENATRIAALTNQPIDIVEPNGPNMSDSLKSGMNGLETDGALIVLADMPELTAQDFRVCIEAFCQNPTAIIRAKDSSGRPGHPVLFPRRVFNDFAALSGDNGAAPMLKRYADQIQWIELPDTRATTDLDTPEDWTKWRAKKT